MQQNLILKNTTGVGTSDFARKADWAGLEIICLKVSYMETSKSIKWFKW